MKQLIILCLIVMIFSVSSKEAQAAEDKILENVFKNAYYGAAIGGLLGTAVMIFSDRPADHFNYIAYGLAGGVIAGTFYGMANPARSLTDFEQGNLKLALPQPEIKYAPQIDSTERKKAFLFLPLLKYHF
jgi:hypothetical protein